MFSFLSPVVVVEPVDHDEQEWAAVAASVVVVSSVGGVATADVIVVAAGAGVEAAELETTSGPPKTSICPKSGNVQPCTLSWKTFKVSNMLKLDGRSSVRGLCLHYVHALIGLSAFGIGKVGFVWFCTSRRVEL